MRSIETTIVRPKVRPTRPARLTSQHALCTNSKAHPVIHGTETGAIFSLQIRVLLYHLLCVEKMRSLRAQSGGFGVPSTIVLSHRRAGCVVRRRSPHRFFVFRQLAWDSERPGTSIAAVGAAILPVQRAVPVVERAGSPTVRDSDGVCQWPLGRRHIFACSRRRQTEESIDVEKLESAHGVEHFILGQAWTAR
jgi:hypothetical protein